MCAVGLSWFHKWFMNSMLFQPAIDVIRNTASPSVIIVSPRGGGICDRHIQMLAGHSFSITLSCGRETVTVNPPVASGRFLRAHKSLTVTRAPAAMPI